MANTIIPPEWIAREYDDIHSGQPRIGNTIRIKLPASYRISVPPVNSKALLALGAAAVIANPEPVSRRSVLGLGWWRRHAGEK